MIRLCLDIQSHLSAWIDGELTGDLSASVSAHIAECSECRVLAESLRELDANFEQLALVNQESATRLALNVLSSFATESASDVDPSRSHEMAHHLTNAIGQPERTTASDQRVSLNTPHHSSRGGGVPVSQILTALGSAAAGFFLAWMMFAPAAREVARNDAPPLQVEVEKSAISIAKPELAVAKPAVAQLVAATGSVEFRQPSQKEWSSLRSAAAFSCPSGTEVRTAAGVRCEIETENRSTIRLNGATELAIQSPREIELRAGQVWCSAASGSEFQVVAAAFPRAKPAALPPFCVTCMPNSSLLGAMDSKGTCSVQSAAGEVDVRVGETTQRLKRGEIAKFDDGQLIIEPHHADSLLATSWMQPLLVLKGHDSPELGDRVNRLLASLGQSKLDNLYEVEIRSMGDYAVLPMLRFVQSESSHNESDKRLRAMSIVADIAPSWVIGDLIGLLNDPEPQVRIRAATALKRLTGLTHGRDPDQWSVPLPELKEALEQWRAWWQTNSQRYELRQKEPHSPKLKSA